MVTQSTCQGKRMIKSLKENARELRKRLDLGLDQILEAETAGYFYQAELLRKEYDQLEADYIDAKRSYSKTPEDLLRCPDCPRLGTGLLPGGIICDSTCNPARTIIQIKKRMVQNEKQTV